MRDGVVGGAMSIVFGSAEAKEVLRHDRTLKALYAVNQEEPEYGSRAWRMQHRALLRFTKWLEHRAASEGLDEQGEEP